MIARVGPAVAVSGAVSLMLTSAPATHAQERPSFGGLYQQVQGMLVGEQPFQSISFGTGECWIGVNPDVLRGLIVRDPDGFRLIGDGERSGLRLLFGQGDDCRIEVLPGVIPGLLLRDPVIRILPPVFEEPLPPILTFGPTDDCRILVPDPTAGGLVFQDPNFFRFENIRGTPVVQIPRGFLEFGTDCRIGVELDLRGIVVSDPGGLRVLGVKGAGMALTFGDTDFCRIFVDPLERPNDGIILTDPNGFIFESPVGPEAALVTVKGTLTAGKLVQESSRRLKENVRPIDNALDAVTRLRGVRFEWKEDVSANRGTDLGFIAEEVAEVVPEAAVFNKENEPMGVNFANLVALAVEGIKAQQEQIEAQQKLIEELKEEIAALRSGK